MRPIKQQIQRNIVSPVDRLSEGFYSTAAVKSCCEETNTCDILYENQLGYTEHRNGVRVLSDELPDEGDIVEIHEQYGDVVIQQKIDLDFEKRILIKQNIYTESDVDDAPGFID